MGKAPEKPRPRSRGKDSGQAPEKDPGQATGGATALGTAYAADDERLVWVHSHICVEPLQIIEEHILRRRDRIFDADTPTSESGPAPNTKNGKGIEPRRAQRSERGHKQLRARFRFENSDGRRRVGAHGLQLASSGHAAYNPETTGGATSLLQWRRSFHFGRKRVAAPTDWHIVRTPLFCLCGRRLSAHRS